jgi:hypothetical protein
MNFELKPLSREAIPAALEKAQRYRLLNEPVEAESICLDVIAIDGNNRQALVTLLLALTDQFEESMSTTFFRAHELVAKFDSDYARSYYEGIVYERRARAHHKQRSPFSGASAYEWFRKAMQCYEAAERLRAPGDDDAILRWNTCARLLMRHPELAPAVAQPEPVIQE